MTIERVSADEYAALFPNPGHVFNSVAFNELNRHKCDDIHYLVFKSEPEGKVRLGIVLGERSDCMRSPFSAPFGGFEAVDEQITDYYLEAAALLGEYSDKPVTITLPPTIYETPDGHLAKQQLALLTAGAVTEFTDFNYSLPLQGHRPEFNKRSQCKLRKAMRQEYAIEQVSGIEGMKQVYDMIVLNHESLGYPVWMTFDDVVNTTGGIVKADFFILTIEGTPVAGALIYHATENIRQLIYWGDDPAQREKNGMLLLARHIIDHYTAEGATEYDLGPASKDGIPNRGLCFFKESIGCRPTTKPTLTLHPRQRK